jgi:hypothetical protein
MQKYINIFVFFIFVFGLWSLIFNFYSPRAFFIFSTTSSSEYWALTR